MVAAPVRLAAGPKAFRQEAQLSGCRRTEHRKENAHLLILALDVSGFVPRGWPPPYSEKLGKFYQECCASGFSSSERRSCSEGERGALVAGLGSDGHRPSRWETRAYLVWCCPCQEGQAPAGGNGAAAISGWLSENLVACQE